MKTIITKTTLVFSLLSTFAIGLSSCNNKKEIKYLDHSDYGTTLKSNVCTTVMYDNANYYYDICNNLKVKSQFSTFDPFDTSLFIRYSADRLSTQDIVNIETIFGKSISKMHALFDSNYYYLDDDGQTRINNLHMLNSNYGKEEIEIDKLLYDVLEESKTMTVLSRGKFNIFIGDLSNFWNNLIAAAKDDEVAAQIDPSNYAEFLENHTPELDNSVDEYVYNGVKQNSDNFSKALNSIPDFSPVDNIAEEFDKILTLRHEGNKYFAKFNKYNDKESMSITLGAIGKGFATEIVKDELIKAGYTKGLIYGGGSSIVSLGDSYINSSWRISMTNPLKRNESIGRYSMKGQSNYTTSGDQQRGRDYTLLDGTVIRRHHIIDPTTGFSNNYYRSVSVESSNVSAGFADAISTTLMNLKIEDVKKYIEDINNYFSNIYNTNVSINIGLFEEVDENSINCYLTSGYKKNFSTNSNTTKLNIIDL